MYKVTFKLQGQLQTTEGLVPSDHSSVQMNEFFFQIKDLKWAPPISGTVYGTLLNYQGVLSSFGDQIYESPYKEPPKAPILYLKPLNTINACHMPIPLPNSISHVEVGATLGIVFEKTATRVTREKALDYVAGYTVANDVTVPHKSVFRPAVQHRSRDGFCPIGPWVIEKNAVSDPNNLAIRVFVNDKLVQENTTANLIRSVSDLIAEVTEFMTLHAGDVLLVGVPENPPLVTLNDKIRIEIDQVGVLENQIKPEMDLKTGGECR